MILSLGWKNLLLYTLESNENKSHKQRNYNNTAIFKTQTPECGSEVDIETFSLLYSLYAKLNDLFFSAIRKSCLYTRPNSVTKLFFSLKCIEQILSGDNKKNEQ